MDLKCWCQAKEDTLAKLRTTLNIDEDAHQRIRAEVGRQKEEELARCVEFFNRVRFAVVH